MIQMPNLKTAILAAAFGAAATTAFAAPSVTAAWSRPASKGGTGAGFLTLTNPGPKPDTLVSVEAPIAGGGVQMHQSMVHDGMAMMHPVTGIPVPARGSVTLAPGGYHLMFLQLRQALAVGDKASATLTFASGAKVKATFVVGLAPPVAAPAKR